MNYVSRHTNKIVSFHTATLTHHELCESEYELNNTFPHNPKTSPAAAGDTSPLERTNIKATDTVMKLDTKSTRNAIQALLTSNSSIDTDDTSPTSTHLKYIEGFKFLF